MHRISSLVISLKSNKCGSTYLGTYKDIGAQKTWIGHIVVQSNLYLFPSYSDQIAISIIKFDSRLFSLDLV
jgi:hypothetical protein